MSNELANIFESKLAKIFEGELTEQGLQELREKYPPTLIMDMSDDENLKAARKIRTDRNKLVEALDRRRIDKTAELKGISDGLIESVNQIYSVVVDPFEKEDKRRKEIKAEKARKEKELIDADRAAINQLKGFVTSNRNSTSSEISSSIDAVSNIDVSDFHKDLVHEAIQTKKDVLEELTAMLANRASFERMEAENKALEEKQRVDASISEIRNSPMMFFDATRPEVIQAKIDYLSGMSASEGFFGDRWSEAKKEIEVALDRLITMRQALTAKLELEVVNTEESNPKQEDQTSNEDQSVKSIEKNDGLGYLTFDEVMTSLNNRDRDMMLDEFHDILIKNGIQITNLYQDSLKELEAKYSSENQDG